MTNPTRKAGAFAALPAALALALITAAFAGDASAKPLAEPTISMMNKCALTGTIEQVGRTHVKCCTEKYCIWCNTETNECWVKGKKTGAAGFTIMSKPALKLRR